MSVTRRGTSLWRDGMSLLDRIECVELIHKFERHLTIEEYLIHQHHPMYCVQHESDFEI